ncbi:MAG: hypothetical protein ACM3MG_13370, partial [Bacillota bacterium]
MKKVLLVGTSIVGVISLVVGCVSMNSSSSREPSGSSVVYQRPEGLSGADLANFEHLTEGSDIYPYEWLKVLRSVAFPDKNGKFTQPFYQDLNIRFGVLPSKSLKNEHGQTYQISYTGMTSAWSNHPPEKSDAFLEEREIVRQLGGVKSIKMVGVNCAFCHSGSLDFKGTNYRIHGSPSMTDVRAFFKDMMTSTLAVLAKEELTIDFLKRMNVPDAETKAKELNRYFFNRLGETTHGIINAGTLSAQLTLLKAKYFKDTNRLFKGKEAISDSLEKLLRMTYGFSDTDDIG